MTASPAAETRRPFGITAIALLQLATAAWIASGIFGLRPLDPGSLAGKLAASDSTIESIFAGLTAVLVVATVLLWLGNRVGWLLSMLLTGFQLAFMLISISQGGSDWIRLLLLTITALYLNQRAVIARFADDRPRQVALPLEGPASDGRVAGAGPGR
jgi:fructose-specific phosphotransferase system IIC component